MNKQEFLEYLKDPLKAAVCGSEREIEQLFGHQIIRTMIKMRVQDEYLLSIYADNPDIFEDIHPRVVNLIAARLPRNSGVTTHGTTQIFRLHGESPTRFEREYFICYNWQT